MTPEEYQWTINSVQDRYHTLNLNYEQAERVFKHEQDKNIYSNKSFFSDWEEWDYDLTTFRGILNDDQYQTYYEFIKGNIQGYEQSLVERDAERTNDIAFHEAAIRFYETDFLPEFFKDPIVLFGWLSLEKTKIEYLKAEYKLFLLNSKKEIQTSHFRHYRLFSPNELKVSLLRHRLSYLLPDYTSFEHQMDVPTKSIADHVKNKLYHLPEELEELLKRKFLELSEFHKANFKKHYSDNNGWHFKLGYLTPEEEKKHRNMSLLLLDKEKYG